MINTEQDTLGEQVKKLSKLTNIIGICAGLLLSSNATAWGQNGHRVVAQIALNHLTPQTQQAILPLLDGEKLAEVSTWPDEMRSHPSDFCQKQSTAWHYINISKASEFKPESYDIPATKKDIKDAYDLMIKATHVLKDDKASIEDKQFYFKFLVHVVGDIHQPMHVGRSEDWGGNKIKVKFFGEDTNLHGLWDTLMVENQNLSFTEFTDFIDTQDAKIKAKFLNSQPKDWVIESFYEAQKLYNVGNADFKYNYVYEQSPLMKQRLTQGGIRLAGLLNGIFDKSAKPLVNALKK